MFTNIKMYEKAREIQKLWKPKNGDYISQANDIRRIQLVGKGMWFTFYLDGYKYSMIANECIKQYSWLPTQEDLQKMLQGKWIYYGSYPLSQFCGWINTSGGPDKFYHHQYKSQFKSINELWLAFVMEEKYNKMWNGKGWVIQDENNKKK